MGLGADTVNLVPAATVISASGNMANPVDLSGYLAGMLCINVTAAGTTFLPAFQISDDGSNWDTLPAPLLNVLTPAPGPSQPAVPATGVAQQNANSYPVQVVISANGATITNVSVNGITVGTAAGTYFVPAYGSISIAYSVATPTWVWSNPAPAAYAPGAPVAITAIGRYYYPLALANATLPLRRFRLAWSAVTGSFTFGANAYMRR